MKNYQSRLIGLTPFLEVNVTFHKVVDKVMVENGVMEEKVIRPMKIILTFLWIMKIKMLHKTIRKEPIMRKIKEKKKPQKNGEDICYKCGTKGH